MRHVFVMLTMTAFLVAPYAALSKGLKAHQLFAICKEGASETQLQQCESYVLGWRDSFRAANLFRDGGSAGKALNNPKMDICLSDGNYEKTKMVLALRRYLANNPQYMNKTSTTVTIMAMREVFPCKR